MTKGVNEKANYLTLRLMVLHMLLVNKNLENRNGMKKRIQNSCFYTVNFLLKDKEQARSSR